MIYNSKALRHIAEHFDQLLGMFPDLSVDFDKQKPVYYSNLINQIANEIKLTSVKSWVTGANPEIFKITVLLKLEDCLTCKDFYEDASFVITSRATPINIWVLETVGLSSEAITVCAYEDALKEQKINSQICNKIDLEIINWIKNKKNLTQMQLNERVKKLLIFN